MRKASVILFLVAVAASAFILHRPVQEMSKADILWEQGNELYQQERYRECLEPFNNAMILYTKAKDKVMITTTQVCMAYAYYLLAEEYTAKLIADQIRWDYVIEDGMWNRTIADLYSLLGDELQQVKYLRRAKQYGYK